MKRALLVAVLGAGLAVRPASAETVRVMAAASLKEAFEAIGALYRENNPGHDIEFNFAGSQILRTQIEEGAEADVFAPADRVHMETLVGKGLAETPVLFARNGLVVVTPRERPKVRRLGDLAKPGVRIVIADANVPVGRYTTQILGKMNRAGLFGDDFQKRVLANVVSQETNVRAVLAKVALDEVDAGFVYVTDARTAAEQVLALSIPDRMNVIAEYPIAVLSESPRREQAARFVALVLDARGRAILERLGFLRAP